MKTSCLRSPCVQKSAQVHENKESHVVWLNWYKVRCRRPANRQRHLISDIYFASHTLLSHACKEGGAVATQFPFYREIARNSQGSMGFGLLSESGNLGTCIGSRAVAKLLRLRRLSSYFVGNPSNFPPEVSLLRHDYLDCSIDCNIPAGNVIA